MNNKLISWGNSAKFYIVEPIKLNYARNKYKNVYSISQKDPLISIMIPTYNRGKLLVERTLPSIFGQTYQNFEIVIVGDCCSDNTSELISKIKDPRVRFYNLKKRGKYPTDVSARWFVAGTKPANKALELVKGKWIAWLDDDDVFTLDHIEVLLRFAQKKNYEFVAALYEEERKGNKVIIGHRTDEYPEYGGHSTWLYRSYLRFFKYNIHSWRKSWNRPVDLDLQLRMKNARVRMGFLDKIVTYVLPRPGAETVGLDAHKSDGGSIVS